MGMFATATTHGPGLWIAGSILTNPADTTVLADSGELIQGNYLVAGAVSASGVAKYRLIVLSQDLGTTRYSMRRYCPEQANDDFQLGNKIPILSGDHIRLIMDGTVASGGNIQGGLYIMEVA
jgi:hypothetical protein